MSNLTNHIEPDFRIHRTPVGRYRYNLEYLESRVFLSADVGIIHTTGIMPPARSLIAVAAVGDEAIFAGGAIDTGTGETDVVDIYNAATNQWTKTRLPEAASDLSVVTAGDKALFYDPQSASGVVYIYDTERNHWTSEQLPQGRKKMTAISVGTEAIFAGGYFYRHGFKVTSEVDIFDSTTGKWSSSKLPVGRFAMSATAVGNLALFAGGFTATEVGSRVVDIYSIQTNRWSAARLSVARDVLSPTAVTVGNYAIFAGGEDANIAGNAVFPVGNVDIYNAAQNTWTTQMLSQDGGFLSPVSVDGQAIIAGAPFPFSNGSVGIFNSVTQSWSTVSLSQDRDLIAAAAAGPYAIFAGGDTVGTLGVTTVDIYDAQTGDWSTTSLSQGRSNIAAITAGSTAIFADGISGAYNSNMVDFFTVPDLDGSISQNGADQVSVTIRNLGASALPGPASLAIYASRGQSLDSSAVLLGSVLIRRNLIAGGAEEISVPIKLPGNLAADNYHLIAAAGPSGQLVQFTSTRRVPLGAGESVARPTAAVMSVFNSGSPINSFSDTNTNGIVTNVGPEEASVLR